ncbi:MAG: hypothetical protein IPM24_19360 [Bryobacterales bacterium]|nr:hypothetical protein [Bryobacterales bacterium]
MVIRVLVLLAAAVCAFGEEDAPRFRAEDVRPHGSGEPHPLVPGLLTWIFGTNLSRSPGCSAESVMDGATYKADLCGTRVLVGGIEARLVAVMPSQINLVLPDHPWENEMVSFQVVRDGHASASVPVYFGFNRPVISLAEPSFAGGPVWIRVEKPWGKGWLRYPFHAEPWDMGPGSFEVRFQGRELPMLSLLPYPPLGLGDWMVGLPREAPAEYRHRLPLHLVYSLDRPGVYQIRYTEYRIRPGSAGRAIHLRSDWTAIEIPPSSAESRRAWFQAFTSSPPEDPVELLSNFLPGLLAQHDELALRMLARYLDSQDPLVRQYAAYALNYFDSTLLGRVVPGRTPLRGGVR